MDYLYNVELPFSKKEIIYRDLNSKQQLNLCKINILFPLNNEKSNFVDYSKLFKSIILECVKNKEDFLSINIIEYILFVTKLRIVSLGNELNLVINNENSEKKEDIKITIDLNFFMSSLYNVCNEALKDNTLNFKNIQVTLDWPSIFSEQNLLKTNDNIEVLDTVVDYIKTIKVNDKNIELYKFEFDERKKMYESFPLSLKNIVEERVLSMIKILSTNNLFGIKMMDGFNFNFYNTSYHRFMRYLFSGNLRNIYQEYYVLASKNINPLYVDNLSISDRTVYYSFIEEEFKARKEQSQDNNSNMTDLQKLINEFE